MKEPSMRRRRRRDWGWGRQAPQRFTITVELQGLYAHDTDENTARWLRWLVNDALRNTHLVDRTFVLEAGRKTVKERAT